MKSRVVHLDKEFFLPGWTKPLLKDWKDKVSQLTSGESWVIEGNYFDVMAARIERSTMFIFLDTPLHERLWGNVRRTLSWLGRVRPDTGQVERLSLRHIANAYGYMKRRSMDFADLERRCGEGGVPWVRLTSRRETEALVNSLKSASVGPWPPS